MKDKKGIRFLCLVQCVQCMHLIYCFFFHLLFNSKTRDVYMYILTREHYLKQELKIRINHLVNSFYNLCRINFNH